MQGEVIASIRTIGVIEGENDWLLSNQPLQSHKKEIGVKYFKKNMGRGPDTPLPIAGGQMLDVWLSDAPSELLHSWRQGAKCF